MLNVVVVGVPAASTWRYWTVQQSARDSDSPTLHWHCTAASVSLLVPQSLSQSRQMSNVSGLSYKIFCISYHFYHKVVIKLQL